MGAFSPLNGPVSGWRRDWQFWQNSKSAGLISPQTGHLIVSAITSHHTDDPRRRARAAQRPGMLKPRTDEIVQRSDLTERQSGGCNQQQQSRSQKDDAHQVGAA